ncbi:hypothetical protein, partial [Mycobacterium tuberculosis]
MPASSAARCAARIVGGRCLMPASSAARCAARIVGGPRLYGMQRIIGTEVEYGISSPSDPTA